MRPAKRHLLSFSLVLAAACLWPSQASAQSEEVRPKKEAKKRLSVRLLAIKATGKLKKGERPAIPPDLRPYQAVLKRLKYDRYYPKGTHVRTGKGEVAFPKLELKYAARVSVLKVLKAERLVLRMSVTRPAKLPKKGRVKVAELTVRVKSGGHFLIKCARVYPDGDLLFLVTAKLGLLKAEPLIEGDLPTGWLDLPAWFR